MAARPPLRFHSVAASELTASTNAIAAALTKRVGGRRIDKPPPQVTFVAYDAPRARKRSGEVADTVCELCGTRSSDTPMFRRGPEGAIVCNRYPSLRSTCFHRIVSPACSTSLTL